MAYARCLPAEGRWRQLIVSAYIGCVIAVFTIIACLSFSTLIFAGDFSPCVGQGIDIALISACVAGVIVAWRSSYPGTLAMPQDRTAPILALMAGKIATLLPPTTSPEAKCLTVLAAIGLTSIVTGTALYVLGRFRLGNLIRFIPYPVVGGFLAGSGWLLVTGCFRVMLGQSFTLAEWRHLLDPQLLPRWLAGVMLGTVLFLVSRRFRRPVLVPLLLFAAFILFYGVFLALGHSVSELRSAGWLPVIPPGEGLHLRLMNYAAWHEVRWDALWRVSGLAGTVLLTAIISILLNSSAFELVVHHEIDLDKELCAAGIANVGAGALGGMLAFQSLSLSRLGHELGSRTRWTGTFAALFCGAALIAGPSALSNMPRFVLGGLLFFLGIGFLVEWLYDAWYKLPFSDYLVVLLILGTISTVGYLEGVGVGILATVFLFVHNYSRVGVITHSLTGAERQSNVDRPPAHQRLLTEHGQEIYVLKLQGFIFFGTATSLLSDIRQRLESATLPRLRFAVLDFRRVSGIDSSAALSLMKARQLAAKNKFMLVLTALPPQVERQLSRAGFGPGGNPTDRIFQDLDHGIEWCEEEILRGQGVNGEASQNELREVLARTWPRENSIERFLKYLEKQTIPAGEHLIRQGSPADALYFVQSGEITTVLELPGATPQRLRRQSSGTVVGELGLFLGVPRTASIVTNQVCSVYRLSAAALEQMKSAEPEVAADFYEFMVRILAERVVNSNKVIRVLSE